MNTENHLMIERQGKLGVITLDRVTHLNALSLDMIEGIGAHWSCGEMMLLFRRS